MVSPAAKCISKQHMAPSHCYHQTRSQNDAGLPSGIFFGQPSGFILFSACMYINHLPFVCCFICHLYHLHQSSLDFALLFLTSCWTLTDVIFSNRVLVSHNLQTSGNIKVLFNISRYILSRFLFNAFPGPSECTDFTLKQKYCMYNQPFISVNTCTVNDFVY